MSDRLKDTLRTDLTDAIRSRDQVRSATLRMVLAAVSNEEVAGTHARELSDDEVQKVVAKEAKKRREASTAYASANRPELAAKEDAELEALVAQAVTQTGATGMPQLGLVMKAVQPLVAGRAEGGRVAAAVRAALAS